MIESIDRALAVLQLFLKEERPLSVTRISKVMELHKSTVSRTLETLEHRGFIQKDEETGKYWLGLQAYALGMLFREKDKFHKVAYPQHIILEKIKSPRTIDTAPPIGAVRPAYCSASGKCLLAFSEDYRKAYTGCTLKKFTEYTVTDWKELLPALDEIRNRGYAIEREEVELGMACVAAPIFRSGRIIAAISVSGPAERVADANRETTIQAVVKTAGDISQALD